MIEQTFGPRRCRDARKLPLDQCVEVRFYRCSSCGSIFHENGLHLKDKHLTCCGTETEPLKSISIQKAQQLCPQVSIDYKIVGGYNDNAVQVFWNRTDVTVRPSWIYLKTFTGGYIKYLSEAKRPPMIFALADMDAFSYCDKSPCLECTFRCKRGFELYAYIGTVGLILVPLDNMSPYWETR